MDGKRSLKRGRIFIIIAALLWGLAGVSVKSITWSGMSIACVRSFFSIIMLFAVKKSFKLKLTKVNIWGGIATAVTGILYVSAIKLTTAGSAIVLQYVEPILVFLFLVIFKNRKAKLIEVVLTFCVFAGCVLSFADSFDFTRVMGNMLAVLSGFAFAAEVLIINDSRCDSEDTMILSNIMSFFFCLPFIFFDKSLTFTLNNIIWVLVISIVQYGIANIVFAKGIQFVDPIEASILLMIEPIFNPIPVAIICGEMMGPLAIIGSIIVIASIIFYSSLPKLEKRFPGISKINKVVTIETNKK